VLVGKGTFQRIRGLFQVEHHSTSSGIAHRILSEQLGGLWLRPREILGKEIEMVGRESELEQLTHTLHQCVSTSRAHLVMVVGEPGIGKSRLAFEFLSHIEQQELRVERILSMAHPFSAGVPFSVAADAIRRLLGVSPEQPRDQIVGRVRALLEQLSRPTLTEDLNLLTQILGIGESSGGEGDEAGTSSRRVLDLLVHIVDWLTSRHPAVVVAEDIHWSDSSSLTLLSHLLEQLAHKPIIIIGLCRPEFLLEHPELMEGPRCHRIDLGPLDHDAMSQLVNQAVGPERGQEVLDLIANRALGNPYHAEELLRTLEERGVLVRRVGGWDLTSIPDDLGIPPGIEAVTQARIDNLNPSQRHLLCQAAAVGRTFWDGLLRWLAEDFSPHDLSVLVQRELVVSRRGTGFSPHQEYSFVHDLTRDVAYRMLTAQRRTELHRRIASWIRDQGASTTEELDRVGRHLDLGGKPEEAAIYYGRAGDAAFAAAAFSTSVLHFSRAIELARSKEFLFEMLARRERVLNALGRWEEQRHDAQRMLELAEQLDQEETRVEALLRIGRALLNLGVHEEARVAFEEAHQRSLSTRDPKCQARSLRWLAMYHFNKSEHIQARPLFEQALNLAEQNALVGLAAELAYELGVTVGTIGDYVRALDVSGQALAMFQQQGNRYQESFCLANIGCFHIYLGEIDEAIPVLEQALELGREMRIPLAEASAQANLGNALRLSGRVSEALELERQSRKVARQIGDLRLAADTLIYGALAALEASGETPQTGERMALEALNLAREGVMPGTEAIALMTLAKVLSVTGDLEQAVQASEGAVKILDQIGSVEGFEQDILSAHAEICARLGRHKEAAVYLGRSNREIERKASFIDTDSRRLRFLERVGRHCKDVERSMRSDGS
jgi:tetratricopeptide (TPR) repeat protein